MNGRGNGADFKVLNPAKVVDEIPCAYFNNSVILNHSVLSYFVGSGRSMDASDAKSQQFLGMLIGETKGFAFLDEKVKPAWRNAECLYRVSCVKDEGWDSEGLKMLEAFLSRNWTGLKNFVGLEPKFEDELRNLVQSKRLVLAHKEQ